MAAARSHAGAWELAKVYTFEKRVEFNGIFE